MVAHCIGTSMEIHAPRLFFNFHKGCHKHVLIKELVEDGNVLTTQVSWLSMYGDSMNAYTQQNQIMRRCVLFK
jgi:hypothetical protein